LTPKDAPDRINVGKTFRPFFIDTLRMEKSLREFVVDYQYWQLYSILGLEEPETVTLVTDVTDAMRQGGAEKTNQVLNDFFSKDTPHTQEVSQASQPSQNDEEDNEWADFVKQMAEEEKKL
jgi:hypothetical protein